MFSHLSWPFMAGRIVEDIFTLTALLTWSLGLTKPQAEPVGIRAMSHWERSVDKNTMGLGSGYIIQEQQDPGFSP